MSSEGLIALLTRLTLAKLRRHRRVTAFSGQLTSTQQPLDRLAPLTLTLQYTGFEQTENK